MTVPDFFAEGTPERTLVKICGVRRPEDVDAAVEAGADAIGFNFWPGSPRYLPPRLAASLVSRMPRTVVAVGVFVDPTEETVREAVALSGVGLVQLHGDEPPELVPLFEQPVMKALRLSGPTDLEAVPRYAKAGVRFFLLDAKSPSYGGGGRTFEWSLARARVLLGHKVVLAGGLHPENVAAAVRAVRPFAVDAASGVELSPGVKDAGRMADFVRAVHEALEKDSSK